MVCWSERSVTIGSIHGLLFQSYPISRQVYEWMLSIPEYFDFLDPELIQIEKGMGDCPKLFGNVTVFVAFVKSSMEKHYRVAQQSLECYLKGVNYTLLLVDLMTDERVQKKCSLNKQLFFKKHCAAAAYLPDTDWMLVLDADTDHPPTLRLVNFLCKIINNCVRNTEFAVKFLQDWGNWEFTQPSNWNGADNGVLQLLIMKTVLPSATQETKNCDNVWHNASDYDTYLIYVSCVKQALGATRLWPGKIRIYHRAHGWVFCDLISLIIKQKLGVSVCR
ncbi:unnamed protein product, partial [Haemonchus placei]